MASPSWKPHRNQWQLVTRESVINIETTIGQQLPTSSKLSGRSNLWIMGIVVTVVLCDSNFKAPLYGVIVVFVC